MNKAFKLIRKLFTTLFLLIATILVATGVYFYPYKGQIIQHFIAEANKKLQYPIQIKAIRLTTLAAFPKVTLVLHDVAIQHPVEATANLLTASKVCCSFDVWELLRGQYILDQLYLEHGKIYLLASQPYQFKLSKATKEEQQQAKPLVISLSKIGLRDMELVYSDQPKHQHYAIKAEQVQASLRVTQQTLQADLNGKASIQSIQLKDLACTKAIPIALHAGLSYDQQRQVFTLHDSQLKQGAGALVLQGRWSSKEDGFIDVGAKGHQVAVQTLLSYLPEQFYQPLKPYPLQGKLGFDMHIEKQPGKHSTAAIRAGFALHEGSLSAKQLARPINLQQVTGRLHIPSIKDLKTATIQVDECTSTLANSKLVGKLSLENFHDFYLKYYAKASLDLASLIQLFPNHPATKAAGQLIGHWKLETSLRQLVSHDPSSQAIKLSGVIKTQRAQFTLHQTPCYLQDLTSSLVFHEDALVMKNLAGSIGPNNFVLNGTLKNFLPFLLADHQKLYLDAKLYADYLDIDALLPPEKASTNQSAGKTTIAPYWVANLVCDIQELRCRRFQGEKVQGKLRIQDQKLIAENLQLGVSGGKAFLNGRIDTSSADSLHLHATAQLQGVCIDSLFYTFENFHQTFLEDKHLSGEVFADLELTVQADKQWHMNWDALEADIATRLNNGALHNFEPIQRLSKYVAEEYLAHLRFSALKNNIQVKNKTIYIPPMEVHSNVTRIQLSGTHTFDGRIAYNLVLPFANFKQKEDTSGLDEIGDDALAGLNLYLKLQGDVHNYSITYDAEAFRASLKNNFKEQGKALKGILQGKYVGKKHTKELAPDDYFEFD